MRRFPQLEALASSARQELVDTFAAHGPCSIADIAPLLGRTPESLYFHVRKLVKVGLLLEAGVRRRNKRDETVYATPGRRMALGIESMTPRRRRALAAIVGASLRLLPGDIERGMSDPQAIMSGSRRTVYSARAKGWLSPDERARIAELFDEIESIMAGARPRAGSSLSAVAITLAPCEVRSSPRSKDALAAWEGA